MSDPYCNLYVGQKVTLTDDNPWPPPGIVYRNGVSLCCPVHGVVYTVRALQFDGGMMRTGVLLVEIVNPVMPFIDGVKELAWWHVRLRPITDISLLEKLLASKPTDKWVKEEAKRFRKKVGVE